MLYWKVCTMEEKKEKKKLLLVAVSVGVFLVIVVSAAILIFRPASGSGSAVSTISDELPNQSAATNISALTMDDSYRGLQDPSLVSPLSEIGADPSTEGAAAGTVISVPTPSAPIIPEVSESAPAVQPVPVRPALAAQASAPRQTAASAAPAQKSLHRDFWVQAGSFSSRERADGVKTTLDNKGLSAIITNQIIDGNTFYRVRVGPYTSRNEADYWLAMVKSIDGFQDSLVWESQSFR